MVTNKGACHMYCLMIKTLKNDCLKSISSKVFDDYEDAYYALRKALKKLGSTTNNVFDGQGNIKEAKQYFKDIEKECKNEDWWTEDYLKPLIYLRSLVLNEDADFKPFKEDDLDCMLTWSYRNKTFKLFSDKEGPDNGILPLIKTNISSKDTEHCYFYVNDNFGGNGRDEYSVNELYIDLIKVDEQ